jgi:hypothetical protein
MTCGRHRRMCGPNGSRRRRRLGKRRRGERQKAVTRRPVTKVVEAPVTRRSRTRHLHASGYRYYLFITRGGRQDALAVRFYLTMVVIATYCRPDRLYVPGCAVGREAAWRSSAS